MIEVHKSEVKEYQGPHFVKNPYFLSVFTPWFRHEMCILRTGNMSIFELFVFWYFYCPARLLKGHKSPIQVDLRTCFSKKPDFSVFFHTFQYKIRQNQTNRFPHLFHKVLVNNFLHTIVPWGLKHVCKISKRVCFIDIKVTR